MTHEDILLIVAAVEHVAHAIGELSLSVTCAGSGIGLMLVFGIFATGGKR